MANGNHRGLPRDLARAADRLTAWRRTRRPKSRIPESLWDLAVKLAAKHGLHRTARTLKLDYYSLKRRADAAEGRPVANGPAFVELSAVVTAERECLIEIVDGEVSLRVQLKGYDAADIAAVGRSLRDTQ
jgi:hypothetical protein